MEREKAMSESVESVEWVSEVTEGLKKEPVNFLNFLLSIVRTQEEFNQFDRSLRVLFMQDRIKKVVISGPGASGKSVMAILLREISTALFRKFKISEIISAPTEPFCRILDDTLFLNFTKTINGDDADPYLSQKLVSEMPEILDWIKYESL